MKKIQSNDVALLHDLYIEIKKNPKLQSINFSEFDTLKFASYVSDLEKCENCKGLSNCELTQKGYYPVINQENLLISYKPCKYQVINEKQYKSNNLIKALYLPKKILEAKLEDYYLNSDERKKCFQYAKEFINNYDKSTFMESMYLYGPYGTGKTFLLAAIANELAKKNYETILMYMPDFVRDIKNSIDEGNTEEKINMFKTVDVLMLDDIGSENITPWVRDEILGPILQYRFLDELPTFFSSNFPLIDLIEHFMANSISQSAKLKSGRIVKRISHLTKSFSLEKKNNE